MKILFAIKNLETAKGGAEKVLAIIASGLAEKGHDISIITFDPPHAGTTYKLHSKVKRTGLGIGDAGQKAGKAETLKRMAAMRRLIKNSQPDLVIGFMHSMFIPLAFTMIGLKIPLIASEHIVPQHYKTRPLEYALLLLASLFTRKITVVSQSVKALYPRFLHHKMEVIPNPVTITKAPETKEKIILNVGRLSAQKDQQTLIRAFAVIAPNAPQWQLRIAGEGEERAALEALIKQLQLDNQVTLLGNVEQIEKQYAAASIFAIPSLYESFGLVTVEAMAFGLPAIGFADCPGTNDIIKHNQNGLLVKRGDLSMDDAIQNFAQALKTLIKDQPLREKLGQAARTEINHYQPQKIIDQWETLADHIK